MPRVSNQRGQGQRLREDLISAARRLIGDASTTDALSIRSVAREAGVAATSVYLHFRDSQEIFRATVATDYQALAAAMGDARDSAGGDPVARLKAIGRAYCDFASASPASYRLITEVVQPIGDDGLGHEGHPATEVQAILADAISQCVQPEQTNVDLVFACLWSSWHGFSQLRLTKPQRQWPATKEFVDLTVIALLSRNLSSRR
jgi:AcrR family transcriptional regulator